MFVADWTHVSSMWLDAERTFLVRRSSSDILNASVTFKNSTDQWNLTFGGTNLSDERFIATGGANLADGIVQGAYNRPREWYARLGLKF